MTSNMLTEIVLPGVVDPEGLQVARRPLPIPAAGQALVRMEATGVSFAEQQMRRGRYYDQPPYPFVPGYDLVGDVTAVGPGEDAQLGGRRVAAADQDRRMEQPPAGRRGRPGRGAGRGLRGRGRDRRGQRRHRLADAAPQGAGAGRADRAGARRQRRCRLDPGPARPHGRGDGDRLGLRAPPRRAARRRRRPRSTTAATSPRRCARSRRTGWTPSSTTSAGRAS